MSFYEEPAVYEYGRTAGPTAYEGTLYKEKVYTVPVIQKRKRTKVILVKREHRKRRMVKKY